MKKFRSLVLAAVLLFAGASTMNAQVTIGGNSTPNATLDVVANPDSDTAYGVIPPKVSIADLDAKKALYTTAQTGAIVYVDDITVPSADTKTAAITAVGYYYFDGTEWKALGGSAATTPLNVTAPELDENYTALLTDDIILFNTSTIRTLALPTSEVSIGKAYHIAVRGTHQINLPAANLWPGTNTAVYSGTSATLTYVGNGKWASFGGM